MSSALAKLSRFVDRHLYAISIVLRVLLVIYSVVHDSLFRVKYTDIDYMIIVDGARAILNGKSPFERATYRYTPLLAALVLPSVFWFNAFGKVLFSACDVAVMYLSDRLLSGHATRDSRLLMLKVFIAFNPVVLNVSTRGNSDMLITFLTVLALYCFHANRPVLAAGVLGFATHFKIYPLIYVPPFVFGLWAIIRSRHRVDAHSLASVLVLWLNTVISCGVMFVAMFSLPTAVSYYFCRKTYLDEAFFYHVVREDHRHNFSPYWLLMYLNMAGRAQGLRRDFAPGLMAFLPQVLVLLLASWKLRRNVAQACCVVTVLFIAFNKVCTVQYFVWFIPLLPFVFYDPKSAAAEGYAEATGALGAAYERAADHVSLYALARRYRRPSYVTIFAVFLLWCGTIPLWVITTYPLEFLGLNHFGRVWLASCVFFIATVALGGWLGRVSYFSQQEARVFEEIERQAARPVARRARSRSRKSSERSTSRRRSTSKRRRTPKKQA